MKNRPRPPIPVGVKLTVAAHQLDAGGVNTFADYSRRDGETKADLLERRLLRLAELIGCPRKELRLDHEPALRRRAYDPRVKALAARYTPNANDPRFMLYRPQGAEFEGSHHIKTNVRGDHGQFSDVVLIKRERRREKRAAGVVTFADKMKLRRKKAGAKGGRALPRGRKRRSANRWPPKGSRSMKARR